MRVFLDAEFTGLHQKSTLVSIGMVAEDDRNFYAEFNDYDRSQVDAWIRENVIERLVLGGHDDFEGLEQGYVTARGSREYIRGALTMWLYSLGGPVEIWADCHAYDWVLFCELFGGALNLPDFLYPYPFDLATLFALKGIDPDIDRSTYAGYALTENEKHNALWDARVVRRCYEKAMRVEG